MYRVCLILFVMGMLIVPSLVTAQGDGTPISLGQAVTGDITDAKPRDSYTFEGTAGDTVVVTMQAVTDGLDSYIEMHGPNGEYFYNDDSFGSLDSMLLVNLPNTGTYTIVATRCCGGGASGTSGPYELIVESASVAPITLGTTTTASVDSSQPLSFVSVSGAPGQIMRLFAARTDGDAMFTIDVRNPDGELVNSVYQGADGTATLDPMFLPDSRDYLLIVSRQSAFGSEPSGERVQLTIDVQTVETQPLAFGDTLTGTLNDDNPSDHYTFEGTAADLLRLSGNQSEGGQTIEVVIYTPQGISVASQNSSYPTAGSFVLDPFQLPETGHYILFIHRFDFTGMGELGSSDYTVMLSPSEIPFLEFGVAVEGSFSADFTTNTYRFTGVSGQVIRFTLESTNDAYGPNITVQGPQSPDSGDREFGLSNFYINVSGSTPALVTYQFTLPTDGIYLFQVSNATYDASGSLSAGEYRLLVELIE